MRCTQQFELFTLTNSDEFAISTNLIKGIARVLAIIQIFAGLRL